ncbi:type II CAAX prenyl endopeptidase Rce1 family protein [Lacinutrix sp.]|uniref:CPBP family glutamic-type intramembrane protease n=1 Tax=Lacinutrix sp. TaxID=1937692 RepID=UPI0035C7CB24
MNFLKKYKYNYLLISAVVIFCTFLILFFGFFYEEEINEIPSRYDSNLGFLPFVFLALIFAPLFEEIAFRGYFTKHKVLKIASILVIPFFILLMKNYFILIIALPYLVLLIINIINKKLLINEQFLFIYSAILFGAMHYKLEHLESVITILPILVQFSLGLLLGWVVLNFNIIKSIIVHCIYNLIFLLPVFIGLQFPNNEVQSLNYNNHKITWEQTPIIGGLKTISIPNPQEVIVKNYTPFDVYKLYDFDNKPNLRNAEMFVKYKLSIEKINDNAIKLDSITVKEMLLKAELLIKD